MKNVIKNEKTMKRLIINLYHFFNIERCRKPRGIKPMGIRSSYYPEGYQKPIERTFSDGTTEIIIPVEAKKGLDAAWEKLGKESIKGNSIEEELLIPEVLDDDNIELD